MPDDIQVGGEITRSDNKRYRIVKIDRVNVYASGIPVVTLGTYMEGIHGLP